MVRFSRSAVTPGPETASLTPRLMIPTNLACCSGNDVQHAKESRGSRGFGGVEEHGYRSPRLSLAVCFVCPRETVLSL
jgi:hypothetical protein